MEVCEDLTEALKQKMDLPDVRVLVPVVKLLGSADTPVDAIDKVLGKLAGYLCEVERNDESLTFGAVPEAVVRPDEESVNVEQQQVQPA